MLRNNSGNDMILLKNNLPIFIKKNTHKHFETAILHKVKCPKEINAPIQRTDV